jgi:hypothetical protein
MRNRVANLTLLALCLAALLPGLALATGFFQPPAAVPKATVEALLNGGFESGRGVGWTESSSGNFEIVTSTGSSPRSGSWWAWLGGDVSLTETLSQQVTIPAGADDVRLGFWYRIVTEESTSSEYDSLRVTVVDAATGATLAESRLSNRNATATYAQAESLNLTAYRGRSVRVTFTATTDSSLDTSFHLDDVSLAVTTSGTAPPPSSNYSDIWWNPSESGWGLTIADHETQLFAVWYTYRQDGSPTWFVIPGGSFSQGRRIFAGDIYQTTGPRYDTATFNPNAVTVTRVGSMSIDFAPPGLATGIALFSYTVGAVSGTKQVQRQPFGSAAPAWGTDVTDIWWNAAESGWGLTLAQHGNNVFGAWFTYDTAGQPLFVVMPGVTFSGADSFSGPLYTTRGPYYGGAFDPSRVTVTNAGNATIEVQSIQGRKRLRFRPVVFGSAVDKQVERQPFGNSPPSEPPPQQSHTLTVGFGGNGTGRVTSNPAGIDCPGQCSANYAQGTSVTLTATPGATSRFTSFTGTCSTPGTTCSFFMSAPASVVATFEQLPPASTLAIAAVPFTMEARPGQFFSQRAAIATGGQPPYSFLADTFANGAPPLGMGIDINGNLTGTPSSTYTSRQTFSFGVCVRDQVQTLKCTTNTVTVAPDTASNVRWTIKSECNITGPVSYKFFDGDRNLVWPSATTHYDVAYQGTNNHNLACTAGALVCVGAQGGGNTWGVGFSGTGSCTNCCARCDTQTYAYTFGCAGPPPPPGGGGVTGSWSGTWNRTFGGNGSGSYTLNWTLSQSGSSVSGSWSWRVNSCNGFCPDAVGATSNGSFATGSVSGTTLSLVTTGGTTFNGTVSGNSISGTSGGSFPGSFTVTR